MIATPLPAGISSKVVEKLASIVDEQRVLFSDYDRIAYSIQAYDNTLREWEWCKTVALWAFRYPWPARTYQDYFTFVTPDFIAKPIYLEVQRYARGQSSDFLPERGGAEP